MILTLFSLLGNYKSNTQNRQLLVGLSMLLTVIIIWVKNQITFFYKERLKEKLIKELENELVQEKNKNKNIYD